jgi:hypothetical protein
MNGIPQTEAEVIPLIEAHWRQHRPQLTVGLTRLGSLGAMVESAAKMTLEGMAALMAQGIGQSEAWDLIKHEWAFPPAESPDD